MVKKLVILASLAAILVPAACSPLGDTANDCPRATRDMQLLIHEGQGYCLLYPTEYTAEHPNDNETVLVVGSLLNVDHPRAYIEVDGAAGRTASQVADELVAQFEAAPPGITIERALRTIGGETAIVLDNVPGQDTGRQVVMVHGERLYKLSFVPADKELGEVYTQMENLCSTVINSFHVLSGE